MAGVANYSLEIKPAAAKSWTRWTMRCLPGSIARFSCLPKIPARRDARNLEGTKTNGASAWATGVSCTSLTMPLKRVSVTRVAHRREVYE
jgi:hypothetical protein